MIHPVIMQEVQVPYIASIGLKQGIRWKWQKYLFISPGTEAEADTVQPPLAVDLSSSSIEEALMFTYRSMSFGQLIHWHQRLIELNTSVNSEVFFNSFQYRWDERLEKAMKFYLSLPTSFQTWMAAKSVGPKDLEPFYHSDKCFHTIELEKDFFEKPYSKSEGLQILQLLSDLCSVDTTLDSLRDSNLNNTPWIERLKKLRYPQTYKRDLEKRRVLEALAIPKKLQPKWVRQGDTSGIEVRLLIREKAHFEDQLQSLKRILSSWN